MPSSRLRASFMFCVALLGSSCCAAFQNEPEGFRGIAWGASAGASSDLVVSRIQAPGLIHVERSESLPRLSADAKYYVRNGDKLGFGPVAVDTIHYLFHQDRLVSVTLTYQDTTRSHAGERYSYQHKLGDKAPRNYDAKASVEALLREYFSEPTSEPSLLAKMTMRASQIEYQGAKPTIVSECDDEGLACILEFRGTALHQAYLQAVTGEAEAARAKAAASAARPDF